MPLLPLQEERQGCRQSSSTGIAVACFNEPWQPGERILGHLSSECAICHLSAEKALLSPCLTGRQWEVFALEEKCRPGEVGGIKILAGVGAEESLFRERVSFLLRKR